MNAIIQHIRMTLERKVINTHTQLHTHTVSVREGLIRGEQLVKPRGGDKGCSPVTII